MEPKDFDLINHNTNICIHIDEHHRNTVHLLRACHMPLHSYRLLHLPAIPRKWDISITIINTKMKAWRSV